MDKPARRDEHNRGNRREASENGDTKHSTEHRDDAARRSERQQDEPPTGLTKREHEERWPIG